MAADGDFTAKMAERMKSIKHVILVLSGKGGVGKSTVSAQIALGLVEKGFKVGLLDADLCGPSIPHMLGLQGRDVHQCPEGWVPVHTDAEKKLSAISIAFLLGSKDDPVIWRGPKKTAMIRQFLADVCWGELDYLVVDTPPGTSDEHLTIVECFRGLTPDGAVLVTTPQGVAISDVRREASFCKKVELPILGIVENMSGFACPHCAECTNVFSTGGGERLAENLQVPFLGRVPLDPTLGASLESGENFLQKAKESPAFPAILSVVDKLASM